ncbi:MAG: hypothetical protein JWO78_546 [Micavibrio sp.]|nr:hypothetical protein [Micavibrio sp.]
MGFRSPLSMSDAEIEIFDLLIAFAGSVRLVDEIMARPRPGNRVSLTTLMEEIQEEHKRAATPPPTPE